MSKDNFDAETTQAIAEAEALEAMFGSSGWRVAEGSMNSIIAALRDARSVDVTRPDIGKQVEVNLAIADNLEQWVTDLKGRINNAIMMKEEARGPNLYTRQ